MAHTRISDIDLDVATFIDDRTLQQARKAIDEEIMLLEVSIRNAKSHHNSLSYVNRLPSEMLVKIFMHCVDASYDDATRTRLMTRFAWIRVTYVCHYWRAVALNCPALWATLFFSLGLKWVNEMASRSQDISLHLIADLSISHRMPSPKILARTRSIHLSAASQVTLSAMRCPTPALESLTLKARISSDNIIPENFFQKDTPCLRRLELEGYNLGWDSALFQRLTHLKLTNYKCSYLPSTEQLPSILQSLCSLESLHITDALTMLPTDATTITVPPSELIVELGRLAHLSVSSSILECANFFNYISCPALTTLQLECKGIASSGCDFSTILDSLFRFMSSSSESIHNLIVDNCSDCGLQFQGWTGRTSIASFLYPPSSPAFRLKFIHHRKVYLRGKDFMQNVCKALPLKELRHLRLSHVETIDTNTWITAFGRLPNLQRVHAERNSVLTIGRALTMKCNFQALRYLSLAYFDFEEVKSSAELAECLEVRYKQNTNLRGLVLCNCHIPVNENVRSLVEMWSRYSGMKMQSE